MSRQSVPVPDDACAAAAPVGDVAGWLLPRCCCPAGTATHCRCGGDRRTRVDLRPPTGRRVGK